MLSVQQFGAGRPSASGSTALSTISHSVPVTDWCAWLWQRLGSLTGLGLCVRLRLSLNGGREPRTECMMKTLLQAPPPYWPRHKCKLCLWIDHKLFLMEHFKSDKENAFPLEWNPTLLQSEFNLINNGTGYWGTLQITSLKGFYKENNHLSMMSPR